MHARVASFGASRLSPPNESTLTLIDALCPALGVEQNRADGSKSPGYPPEWARLSAQPSQENRRSEAQEEATGRAKAAPHAGEEYNKYDVSVTGEVFGEMMINEVFPAARQAFAGWSKIIIQLDGARAHTKGRNAKKKAGQQKTSWEKLMEAAENGQPAIELVVQPANSPDTNKCDLGFFSSLDACLPRVRAYKPDLIVAKVHEAFSEYDPAKLQKLEQTWQLILRRISEHDGDNDYVLPHSKDYGLSRVMPADFDLYDAK